MTPAPLTLPPHLASRLDPARAARLVGVGNADLLAEPLLGFVASRACPANVLIETLNLVPRWVEAGRVLISGFHSPLEQQVLKSLLRRQGRAIKALARGIDDKTGYRPAAHERAPLETGRLLILAASAATRTTRASALERNQLALSLATEIHAPHITPNSPLSALLAQGLGTPSQET
jgi:predicted Rossmann fold nucleotide-binding protein DprA/Smf involved in DNA uptake